MWRATAGQQVKVVAAQQDTADDEWETDSDFVVNTTCAIDTAFSMNLYLLLFQIKNTVSEKEQRWGSKSVQGSGRVESIE
jgi:hypothetical protein